MSDTGRREFITLLGIGYLNPGSQSLAGLRRGLSQTGSQRVQLQVAVIVTGVVDSLKVCDPDGLLEKRT